MKLATFTTAQGTRPRVGALVQETYLLDFQAAASGEGEAAMFTDMLTLIRHAEQHGLTQAQELVRKAESGKCADFLISLAEAKLLAPIPKPAKNVFCVGLNYLDHIQEGEFSKDPPEKSPEFFTKAPTCMRGDGDKVPSHPEATKQLDYEGELGVVLGKTGTNIPEADWEAYVFGYTIINDITGRDLQHSHKQWFKGKSLDGSCPMGPFIVTKDEVPDPQSLELTTTVNGEPRQKINTSQMLFKLPQVIAELSCGLTIEPGDIIATGTPNGVGYAMKPPHFLKTGDKVIVSIESLGQLHSTID